MRYRIDKVRQILKQQKLDGVLISSVANIFYLTGYSNFSAEERECYLLITPKKQYLLTDGRYIEAVKKSVPHFDHIEITGKFSYQDELNDFCQKHKIATLGIEEDNLTVYEYKRLKKIYKKIIGLDLSNLRVNKEENEIKKIQLACKLADQAVVEILKKLRVGVIEKEIALEFEKFVKERGGELSFNTIIALGENSATPHHQTGSRKLKEGDFVLIDCGSKVDGYCSDMTRTYIFGKPTEKQKQVHKVVLDSQQKAIDYIKDQLKNGREVSGLEGDKVSRAYIQEQGFEPYSHGLGHGTGILIHEPPRLSPKSKDILKEGMVFSIEPGIYIPGFGGVRIEDLFVIQDNKLIQLTNSPKEFIELNG